MLDSNFKYFGPPKKRESDPKGVIEQPRRQLREGGGETKSFISKELLPFQVYLDVYSLCSSRNVLNRGKRERGPQFSYVLPDSILCFCFPPPLPDLSEIVVIAVAVGA